MRSAELPTEENCEVNRTDGCGDGDEGTLKDDFVWCRCALLCDHCDEVGVMM